MMKGKLISLLSMLGGLGVTPLMPMSVVPVKRAIGPEPTIQSHVEGRGPSYNPGNLIYSWLSYKRVKGKWRVKK